jgi:hypothetical protein
MSEKLIAPSTKRHHCEKICTHPQFSDASMLQNMLRKLVEAEISGKLLKGSYFWEELGVRTFEAYRQNPKRLREKLSKYYSDAGGGANDPIIIELKKNDTRVTWTHKPKEKRSLKPGQMTKALTAKIDEFWGDGACKETAHAQLILQADYIEDLIFPFVKDLHTRIKLHPWHRLRKARLWVDKFDVEAGLEIQKMFKDLLSAVPRLDMVPRHTDYRIKESAPFAVSMGGFTDETASTLQEIGAKWMNVAPLKSGDGVSLLKRLVPRKMTRFKRTKEDPNPKLVRLIPQHWDLDDWHSLHQGRAGKKLGAAKDVRDYALIVRHTKLLENRRRQILFYIAGFSEHGTALAGRYLVKHWQGLWKAHVKGRAKRGGLGDFLILIEGPSHHQKLSDWSEDKHLEAITPKSLFEKDVACLWADRYSAPKLQSRSNARTQQLEDPSLIDQGTASLE